MVKEILTDTAGKILSYVMLAAILAIIIFVLWQKINWPDLNFSNPFGGNPFGGNDDEGDPLGWDSEEVGNDLYSFPNGRGGRVNIDTSNFSCYRPLRFGDRGEEVKYFQVLLNKTLAFEEINFQIKVNGRFNQDTKKALELLESWYGSNGYDNEGYRLAQMPSRHYDENIPCNF